MINYEQVERNKNKIVNFLVIILALIIAFRFYQSANTQVSLLVAQQSQEKEKNKLVEDIAVFEKKADAYKKVFIKKDLSSIMDLISSIAKNVSVKIVSVKPLAEEVLDNYQKSSFLITLNAPGYHALGDFISKIENTNEIFLVSEVNVTSGSAQAEATEASIDLGVNLKISTISYL